LELLEATVGGAGTLIRALFPSLLFVASAVGTALVSLMSGQDLSPMPVSSVDAQVTNSFVEGRAEESADVRLLPEINADQRAALVSRPLFSETRKPAVALPEPVLAPEPIPISTALPAKPSDDQSVLKAPLPDPPVKPSLSLSGIIRSKGVVRALLYNASTGKDKWYARGATIDGWKIVAIEANRVFFKQNEFEFVVIFSR
jgi:hypothetical protein